MHDRFRVLTWPFGPIHQCNVMVCYPDAPDYGYGNTEVGICLECGKTAEEALERGQQWVKNYIEHGPASPEELIEDCFKNYPDLFPDRPEVLKQLFLTSGCGYDWLDGALVNCDQAPPPVFNFTKELLHQQELLAQALGLQLEKPARPPFRVSLPDRCKAVGTTGSTERW